MADVTQAPFTLLAHATLTNADTLAGLSFVGTEVDVRTFLSANVYVYHAPIEAIATDPGINYILQGRWDTGANENEHWADLWTFTSGTTLPVIANIGGTEAAGEKTIAVDDDVTASYTENDIIYAVDGTQADSEWCRVGHISTTIISIVDGLKNAKADTDFFFNQAEIFVGHVDLSGLSYVRMIVQGIDVSGSNVDYKAEMIAFTDFT